MDTTSTVADLSRLWLEKWLVGDLNIIEFEDAVIEQTAIVTMRNKKRTRLWVTNRKQRICASQKEEKHEWSGSLSRWWMAVVDGSGG